jgi:hypothetical protein
MESCSRRRRVGIYAGSRRPPRLSARPRTACAWLYGCLERSSQRPPAASVLLADTAGRDVQPSGSAFPMLEVSGAPGAVALPPIVPPFQGGCGALLERPKAQWLLLRRRRRLLGAGASYQLTPLVGLSGGGRRGRDRTLHHVRRPHTKAQWPRAAFGLYL